MGSQFTGTRFPLAYNGLDYEILAIPIIYGEGQNAFHSGNWQVEILMPDGSWLKTDFYPENNDLFDTNLDARLSDSLSSSLIKLSQHGITNN